MALQKVFDISCVTLLTFLASLSPSSSARIPYADLCNSVVPESTPTVEVYSGFALPQSQDGFYNGARKFLYHPNPSHYNSLSFETPTVHQTDTHGVFQIQGTLVLYGGRSDNNYTVARNSSGWRDSASFSLRGFWSESSGELCMVGSAEIPSEPGDSSSSIVRVSGVLKLRFLPNPTISTGLVNGTLKSLQNSNTEPDFFDPISILMFPQTAYSYSLGSENYSRKCPTGSSNNPLPSLGLRHLQGGLCSTFTSVHGLLKYSMECNSSRRCNPFAEDSGYTDSLPGVMSIQLIQCSEEAHKLRVLMAFAPRLANGLPFDPSTALVGEGSWDPKRNRLCVVACRLLVDVSRSPQDVHVGDCSFSLSLWLPATISMTEASKIAGRIWTVKAANAPGYFQAINFWSLGDDRQVVSGTKYNYTKHDSDRKSCSAAASSTKKDDGGYPRGDSFEMRFQFSTKSSSREMAWGDAYPLFVEDRVYDRYGIYGRLSPTAEVDGGNTTVKMSYRMSFSAYGDPATLTDDPSSFFNTTFSSYDRIEISAEGIYNPLTGKLCMAACRHLELGVVFSANHSMDCEIRVDFEFPPLQRPLKGEGRVVGTVTSTRKGNDTLYFKTLNLSGSSFSFSMAAWTIWRMDLEMVLATISETFICVFIWAQLRHGKRHHGVLPNISLLMLLILAVGHMIPLLLNFEAIFLGHRRNGELRYWGSSGGWLEVDEALVRIASMAAFLIQSRLLLLAWSARFRGISLKDDSSWGAEKKSLFLSLPLYLAGAMAALLLRFFTPQRRALSVLDGLRSGLGLVLDGFLLPQIIFNAFQNLPARGEENTLSPIFYVGTTMTRLLPHAYDLYRCVGARWSPEFDAYPYADPGADFYSPIWDVAVAGGCLLLAFVVHLQQKHGGRCVLPRRFRTEVGYDEVPLTVVDGE